MRKPAPMMFAFCTLGLLSTGTALGGIPGVGKADFPHFDELDLLPELTVLCERSALDQNNGIRVDSSMEQRTPCGSALP